MCTAGGKVPVALRSTIGELRWATCGGPTRSSARVCARASSFERIVSWRRADVKEPHSDVLVGIRPKVARRPTTLAGGLNGDLGRAVEAEHESRYRRRDACMGCLDERWSGVATCGPAPLPAGATQNNRGGAKRREMKTQLFTHLCSGAHFGRSSSHLAPLTCLFLRGTRAVTHIPPWSNWSVLTLSSPGHIARSPQPQTARRRSHYPWVEPRRRRN
jgi:hypothetical protein